LKTIKVRYNIYKNYNDYKIYKTYRVNRYALKISGPAGAGIMQAGETLSKALNRLGFFTLVYPEYPSRIRGGDNHIQVIFSQRPFLTPDEKIDLLLAFGKKNFEEHKKELRGQGVGFESSELGLEKIAEKIGNPLVINTAGLGFLWSVLGFEKEVLGQQVKEDFKDKPKVLEINLKAVSEGFSLNKKESFKIEIPETKKEIENYTGNEILTKAILKAGCRFAAIYPMTPINSILTLLAEAEINLFRPEDEIAGIMAAIGASYAGDRSMVATSGGGFSLMVEGLGLAGIAEIPIVIVLGQRTGPSTGMATFSSQADLNFAINAGHGEFPRIVLTPGDLEESYRLGLEAFNLAERYQVPVILMTDKYLAESRFSVEKEIIEKIRVKIDRGKLAEYKNYNDYKRYEFSSDGISKRAFPGQTAFITNSYEHNESGFSDDDSQNRIKMMEKRAKKLDDLKGGFEVYGEKGAKTFIAGWGSTKEILLDLLKDYPDLGYLHFWRPWPFPKEAEAFMKKAEKVIIIEGNFSGQLADLIKKETGIMSERILKDDGRPFFKEELAKLISKFKK